MIYSCFDLWNFIDGVIYLNATRFRAAVTGQTVEIVPPGEPFEDLDGDGTHDLGESWLDMNYLVGGVFEVADGSATERETEGAPFNLADVAMRGIFYTNGQFDATGSAHYYGSVIAQQGVVEDGGGVEAPDIYWDESIQREWPPQGWKIPRVLITRWMSDVGSP